MAQTYNLIKDFTRDPFTQNEKGLEDITSNPQWIIAIVRMGFPLSFSRKTMSSLTTHLDQGALLRADKPLVITDDCIRMTIGNSKRSHTKTLTATLKQTDINYLVEVLPGDWILAWIVNNEYDFNSLIERIDKADPKIPCNFFGDGFKFLGRVHSIRKRVTVNKEGGTKTSDYALQCVAFKELDSQFFYDPNLSNQSDQSIGTWLARLGLDVSALFHSDQVSGIQTNNVNVIIPTLIDLIVGKGVSKNIIIDIKGGITGEKTFHGAAGAGASREADYAYVIPAMVGTLLGKTLSDAAKPMMAYADILELLQGVQEYPSDESTNIFTPKLDSKSTPQRRTTPKEMLGTFLPFMPEFTNRPLWQIFQQYLNPAINEIYTCMRVNPDDKVVPTIVLRQIPFTTEAFDVDVLKSKQPGVRREVGITKFLSLPRWVLPNVMINNVDIGRSDATRTNFVHVYGSALASDNNVPITNQITNNPPIRDDLDIQRSGLHSYMSVIECAVQDETGDVPSIWMNLVADWMIGSQYTLNGTIESFGVQAPICEGDNLEFDGVVYHIESVTHNCSISVGDGKRTFTTTMTLTNGMRANGTSDVTGLTNPDNVGAVNSIPIYPGFDKNDNTTNDPGLSLEGNRTTGGASDETDRGRPFDPTLTGAEIGNNSSKA